MAEFGRAIAASGAEDSSSDDESTIPHGIGLSNFIIENITGFGPIMGLNPNFVISGGDVTHNGFGNAANFTGLPTMSEMLAMPTMQLTPVFPMAQSGECECADAHESVHRLIKWSGLILQKFLCHVRQHDPDKLPFYKDLLLPACVRQHDIDDDFKTVSESAAVYISGL